MIRITKLDYRLLNIPLSIRTVYFYKINNKNFFTFDYNYFKSIINHCSDVDIKHLQKTNRISTKFTKKKIVDSKHWVFEIE